LIAVAAVVAAGCGDDPFLPDISIGIGASWSRRPETRDALGFSIYGFVTQRQPVGGGRCRDLPASSRLTVDGNAITPLTRNDGGCLDVEFTTVPSLDWSNQPVTVRYEEGGKPIAEAVFSGLAPGVGATLVTPAGGMVCPGDELLIVPPAAVPTSHASHVKFHPLDPPADAVWDPSGVDGTTAPVRMADGMHVTVPPMTGRAAIVMPGTPLVIYPEYTCEGFASCWGNSDTHLGPVFVTVVQP
jgi:hypothetical protein